MVLGGGVKIIDGGVVVVVVGGGGGVVVVVWLMVGIIFAVLSLMGGRSLVLILVFVSFYPTVTRVAR